ncbi:MAG: site-specific DNA-methyltransferase, partial [Anaerolineae bacterium]|nr:site-specific DNA-methyltransferase [Anaerolineae bacterium]
MSEQNSKPVSPIPPIDVAAFIAEHGTPYDPETDDYRRPPFAQPVKAGKNSPIYNAHSYHTKVPPEGIVPYIKHYTAPGDLVLDPFCGSGMTGVAALMSGRHAILNDLSPAAAHIAYNYCTPVDVDALKREFARIQAAVKEEFDWLYGTTCDRCGGPATIQYTIWSDVFECGRCRAPLVLWELAVAPYSGKVQQIFTCPECGKQQNKKGLRRLSSVPVITNYACPSCKPGRNEHPTTEAEKQRLADIETKSIPYWYPKDEFPLGRQTRKIRHGTAGISHINEMYTYRNVRALSRLWAEFQVVPDSRLQMALQFTFTAIALTSTKMYAYRDTRKGGIHKGTLYVPSLNCEMNVLESINRKVNELISVLSGIKYTGVAYVRNDSATNLGEVVDESIDYIFTDPPFGHNLQYAELNFVWESWLHQFTDWSQDCVMNYVHKKDLNFYSRMMTQAFVEMYRVLKPGRWASIVFHNTDDTIWQAIQKSAQTAGFEVVNAMAFDKRQGTFNQVNMGKDSAAGFDVVLNLNKLHQAGTNSKAKPATDIEIEIARAIASHLAGSPLIEHRTTQYLHSYVIRHLLEINILIEKVTIPYLETVLPHYFKQIERYWYLRGEQIVGQSTYIIKTETDAITWLRAVLANGPQSIGDLTPQWQLATLDVHLPKALDQILVENFWQDLHTGLWRTPTTTEREQMSAQQEISDKARQRQLTRYLQGESDLQPTSVELCGWVEFAYRHEHFAEAVRLFASIHEPDVDADLYRKTRKIAQVCR